MKLRDCVSCSLALASLAAAGGLAAQAIPTSAGAAYGSDLKPPPHPELHDMQPLEVENNAGLWKARRSTEKMVVTGESKPVEMKKTKFGGDVTEPSGVFKSSLLDTDINVKNAKPAEKASPKPRTAKPKANESASPAPAPVTKPAEVTTSAAPAQNVELSLATSPAPVASATPKP